MNNLAEEVGRITSILEIALSEKDWESVQNIIDSLDEVYVELDRQETGFDFDYEQ